MKRWKTVIPAMALMAASCIGQDLVSDVRAAIARNDFQAADTLVKKYRASSGATPEWLFADSWIARGLLARKDYPGAEKYAREVYDASLQSLKSRPMDREPTLPLALGASIEVQGNIFAAKGDRAQAVAYLQGELEKYKKTSIRTRIQKNILLLSLEGKPAPAVAGVTLPKGKPAVVFFWAHWCPDCKAESPIIARLLDKYRSQGLAIVAPTQRFGYIVSGTPAPPDEELRHIVEVRDTYYSFLRDQPVPLSEANHKEYGVSSTPTLVLLDRQGIVRVYNPGTMSEAELDAAIRQLL